MGIIDRKPHIMKIANGEYVAPEKVEIVYNTHPMIAEVFIDGKSTEEYVVGFFVPEEEPFLAFAQENGFSGDVASLIHNKDFLDKFHTTIKSYCQSKGLHSFEIAKSFKFMTTSFEEQGLLTNTMKLKRMLARRVLKAEIMSSTSYQEEGDLGIRSDGLHIVFLM